MRWGNLRRLEPVSAGWGTERGTPVDRHYIDSFFAAHADLIRGRVLEVGTARYVSQFGTGVTSIDIVDIDPRNSEATIVADLADVQSLPAGAFDCAIVPQTLLFVRDPFAAVANLWQALRDGGVLLLTTPAISKVAHDLPDQDRWHLTAVGLAEVLGRSCVGGAFDVSAHGNPIVAVAFLHGIVQEELRRDQLDANHPHFPIVVTAVARKP